MARARKIGPADKAFVLDEYGEFVGLVTMEDVMTAEYDLTEVKDDLLRETGKIEIFQDPHKLLGNQASHQHQDAKRQKLRPAF